MFVGHFIWKHVFHFKWKTKCRHDKHAVLRSSRWFLRRFYASFCCHVVVAWLNSVSISSLFGYLWSFSVVLCFLACFTPLLHSSYCKLPSSWSWTHFLKMHCFLCLGLLRRGIDCWVQVSWISSSIKTYFAFHKHLLSLAGSGNTTKRLTTRAIVCTIYASDCNMVKITVLRTAWPLLCKNTSSVCLSIFAQPILCISKI